jgi:hypothetical protein
MGSLLLRRYVEPDNRAVLIWTLVCGRRGCDRADAAAVPTDEVRAIARPAHDLPADFTDARAILHRRGWQTGKPTRCPAHVTPSWAAAHPQRADDEEATRP